MVVFDRILLIRPSVPIAQGTLSWQPILGAKSACSHSFVALAFWNELEYRNADGRVNSANDRSTSCEDLVNFGPVTPELARVNGAHHLVAQQFIYVRLAAPLLDTVRNQYWVLCGDQYLVCFTFSLGGVTAMPRRLHARLCHAFLVRSVILQTVSLIN